MKQPQEILHELIEQFRVNHVQYKSTEYDESNTRTDFIDKFFESLDWDVLNRQGFSEQYREVVREDRIVIDHRPKAPDYSFRIGGIRKFFVEAKKPSVNIHHDIASAFQLRRYGYTAKLPLSILTNFEELAVYDTKIKPHKNDKASIARIFYCRFSDYFEKSFVDGYETNFDFIRSIFSKEAILKGSFDRYLETLRNKKGTGEVDLELLAAIENWRLSLARNIAKQNPYLDAFHLNVAVQRILDRIIFLRIAEDRRIENYENLLHTVTKKNIYRELSKLFEKADDKYNAGLFRLEDWLNKIIVSDNILNEIITNLYYPECPYEFSVLPIEILGSIYERFLGKTIFLTSSHNVTIKQKPEVRKAGGVYYTPQHIVNYIIRETIGRKTENQPPKMIENLKILDPACGSGSFLVGAYTFLLDTHLSYYLQESNRKKSFKSGLIYETTQNTFRLSINEKQRILLNNIYGVDIDPIAVEVTKLSLYLKLLENETEENLPSLFSHKYLPDWDNNICCGNSLIENSFYTNKQLSLFDNEAMRKANAFEWNKAFPQILNDVTKNNDEGFDCVIGNPPWGQKATKFSNNEKDYFKTKYPNASVGILDMSRFFIEKSVSLLKKDGIWGQVLPDIVLLKNYETTRRFLLDNLVLNRIDHWGKAFQQVNLEACTIIGRRGRKYGKKKIEIGIHQKDDTIIKHKISQSVFTNLPGCKFNIYLTESTYNFVQKLSKMKKFNEFFDVHEGIHSGNVREKLFVDKKLNNKCKKLIFGREEIQRYFLKWEGQWVHYTKEFFKKNDYAGLGKPEYFETKKLIIRRTGDYVLACLDEIGYYFSNNVFICIPKNEQIDLKTFLTILNSRLITWYYQNIQPRVGKIFAEIKINLINDFPIPLEIPKTACQKLSLLADQMLAAQYEIHTGMIKSKENRKILEQRIDILYQQIDNIIYRLYHLSDEEINIIK